MQWQWAHDNKQYWVYAGVSARKQAQGETIKEQVKPLIKFLKLQGYSKNSIKSHLFFDKYTGTTMKRPQFQRMLKHVKPNNSVIVFTKLSRMSRTLDGADKFINKYCQSRHISVYILDGELYFNPVTRMGYLPAHLLHKFVEFYHDTIAERMQQGKIQAKNNGNLKWSGGMSLRFTGKHKRHYLAMYHYVKNHTLTQTAEIFNTSTRTAERVRHDGNLYFQNKKNYINHYINK